MAGLRASKKKDTQKVHGRVSRVPCARVARVGLAIAHSHRTFKRPLPSVGNPSERHCSHSMSTSYEAT